MEWEIWHVWVGASMALIILEIFVPGFVLACLGIGALAGAIAAGMGANLAMQFICAGVLSLVAFVFLRPFALRWSTSPEAVSGIEALVGRTCRVTESFDPNSGLGRCKIDGDDWRAQLSEHQTPQEVGLNATVYIVRVESNTLIVSTQKP